MDFSNTFDFILWLSNGKRLGNKFTVLRRIDVKVGSIMYKGFAGDIYCDKSSNLYYTKVSNIEENIDCISEDFNSIKDDFRELIEEHIK